MKPARLLAGLLLPLGLGLAASAASVPFDEWADSFAADWMRADPSSTTVTQYFSGSEQDTLDRQLSAHHQGLHPANPGVVRAKEGLAALAAFDSPAHPQRQRAHLG